MYVKRQEIVTLKSNMVGHSESFQSDVTRCHLSKSASVKVTHFVR